MFNVFDVTTFPASIPPVCRIALFDVKLQLELLLRKKVNPAIPMAGFKVSRIDNDQPYFLRARSTSDSSGRYAGASGSNPLHPLFSYSVRRVFGSIGR